MIEVTAPVWTVTIDTDKIDVQDQATLKSKRRVKKDKKDKNTYIQPNAENNLPWFSPHSDTLAYNAAIRR